MARTELPTCPLCASARPMRCPVLAHRVMLRIVAYEVCELRSTEKAYGTMECGTGGPPEMADGTMECGTEKAYGTMECA
eukprot:3934767-Rhodomonas_salina.9